ncbi:MAG TPA: phosphatidate cytidylyltransferase, partial [Planctomycetaceae bacterium]|nr:phosphatidate cytidylyltransferase [Planctomycetaceae bacterium]
MLAWRLLLSAVLIPSFVAVFWFDATYCGAYAYAFLVVCLVLAVRCAWELVGLLRARGLPADALPTAVLCVLVIAAGWVLHWRAGSEPWTWRTTLAALGGVAFVYAGCVLVILFTASLEFRAPGRSVEKLGSALLVVSYIGVLTAVTAQLRWIEGGRGGYLALGSLLVAVKMGDTGGYTLGRLFGKRKMVPLLSPGKTWMGGLGALVFAAVGAWAWLHFATPLFNPEWPPPAPHWALLYGLVLGAVGLVGDLAESLIKRDVGRKDAAA